MVADDEGHGTNETADRDDAVGIEDSGVGVVADTSTTSKYGDLAL